MKTVPLHGKNARGRVVLVDDEDYEMVAQFHWCVTEAKRRGRVHGPYAVTKGWLDGTYRPLKMHFLITGWSMVDHKDHDGLNNQRHNLRPTTPRENQQNRRSDLRSTSKFKGVCWNRARGKWLVQIAIDGRNQYLGQAYDEEDGARMYDRAAWAAFGDVACLNFPDDYLHSPPGADPAMFPNRDGWLSSIVPLRPACKKCGGPLRVVSKTGICTRTTACATENKKIRVALLREGSAA